jgi:hypothetical protein
MLGTEALIRCSCDRCGVHNAAELDAGTPVGCCRNCGWGAMTPLTDESGDYLFTFDLPWDPHLPLAAPRA